MRWLFQRGENGDDTPKRLTLEDSADTDTRNQAQITSLPGGALEITVRSAREARDTLAELQILQQELITAKARAVSDAALSIGSSATRQIQRPSRHLRRVGTTAGTAARGFRQSVPVARTRDTTAAVFNGLDAAALVAQTAGGIDDAMILVGSALEAVGSLVADIDLGDFDFD